MVQPKMMSFRDFEVDLRDLSSKLKTRIQNLFLANIAPTRPKVVKYGEKDSLAVTTSKGTAKVTEVRLEKGNVVVHYRLNAKLTSSGDLTSFAVEDQNAIYENLYTNFHQNGG